MHDWSEQQLLTLITQALDRKTETHAVEFKEAAGGSPHKSLWRSISSFSNSLGGGVIVFGVKEHEDKTPEVVGVKNLSALQEALTSYISEKMVNCGKYTLKILSVQGKDLLALSISELPHESKPSYYKDSGLPRGACIRVGNVDKQITDQELRSFLQYSSQYQFDRTIMTEVTIDDLSTEKIHQFFTKSAERTGRLVQPENFLKTLQKLHLIEPSGEFTRPTIAGCMFFMKEPPQEFGDLSRYIVQCVKYAGTSRSTPIVDKQSVMGTIDEQVESVVVFVKNNIKLHAEIGDAKRVDTYEYPTKAIREAIINTLVHRDYSNTDTLVQVAVFSNRIEISNPGTLPPGMSIEDLRTSHFSRNEVIANAMRSLDYIEEFDQGIDLMYSKMAEWGLPAPLFASVSNQFQVTFLGEFFKELNERQITIWHYLQTHDFGTPLELEKLFVEVTRRTLNRDLGEMVDKGFLISAGSTNNIAYKAIL